MEKERQEDMVGTLMAISVISKSLAKKIMKEEEDKDENKVSRCSKEYEKSSR